MLPCMLTNSETHFFLPRQNSVKPIGMIESKKELFFLWVNMQDVNPAQGRFSLGCCCWAAVAIAGAAWNHQAAPARRQAHPRPPPLYGPINRCRGYARLGRCVGFLCSWQSFNWVITKRTWTYAFHTYVLSPLEFVQTHQNLRLRQSSWPNDKDLGSFWNTWFSLHFNPPSVF